MHFNKEGQKVIKRAQSEARRLGCDVVCADHIFLACVSLPKSSGSNKLLAKLGAPLAVLRAEVEIALSRNSRKKIFPEGVKLRNAEVPFSREAAAVLRAAVSDAGDLGASTVGSEHILLGILEDAASMSGPVLREIMKDKKRTAQIVKDLNRGRRA